MNIYHKIQGGGMNGYVGVVKDPIVVGITRPAALILSSKSALTVFLQLISIFDNPGQ